MNVEKGTHLFQNSQTCSPIPGPRPGPRPDSNPISFERKTRREYAYTDPSSSEEEERETSSLVSEYGSEVGAVNLRLEDVHAMEALAEGGSSDEDNDDSDADDNDNFNGKDGSIVPAKEEPDDSLRHYKRDRRVKENDHGISYETLKDRRNNSSDGMQGNSYSHGHGHYHDEDDDNLSQEEDGSVDSVDLSSHYSPTPVASQYEGEDTPHSSDVLPKYATHLPVSLHTPNTPASPSPMMHQQKEDNQPTTPIGAVSAVLRRFGNGVSNMTRCTKTPPQLSPNRYTFVEDLAQQSKNIDDDDNAWLSPRFGNAKHHVPQNSIQLPMFRSAPVGRRRGNLASKAAVKGITSCLSFDPESGRRPYRNMRITDSPPSSPLPSCRKTRSWGSPGSAGSEILGGSVKELMDTSRGVRGLHNSGHRIGQGLGQERLLAPNRDGAAGISPRGHIRFLDDSMYSPKASANARHLVLLQSPQRVDDMEREDALDLLALLVERSVAFNEKMDPSSVGNNNGNDEAPNLDLKGCIDTLREISKNGNIRSNEDVPSHEDRMAVLDQLDHAYTYAMEMKQAALSASTWLTAIGRTGSGETPRREEHRSFKGSQFISEEKMSEMDSNELRHLVQAAHVQLVEKNEISDRLDNELSICRAEIGRLNTMSSRNESSFLSPDKSILDEEGDNDSSESSRGSSDNEFPDEFDFNLDLNGNASAVEAKKNDAATSPGSIADARKEILLLKAELEETNKMLRSMEQGIKWPETQGSSLVDASKTYIDTDGTSAESTPSSKSQGKAISELVDRKVASGVSAVPVFSDDSSDKTANDECAMEYSESAKSQTGIEQNTSIMMDGLRDELEAYVSALRKTDKEDILNLQTKVNELEMARVSSTNPDDKMINVRMLNAENFVTEWDKLGPLPPPPDHDLRSPIVSDLLTQWTREPETQESLLVWVEKAVQGSDCSDIPPLQLSGLDHQVRDGFTMHILPFLLRRSDIQVDVTSRAHRKTSYDLSVTIRETIVPQGGTVAFGQKNPNATSEVHLTSKSPHMMAFKASSTNTPLDYSVDTAESQEKKGFRRYLPSSLETGSVTNSSATTPASNRDIFQSHLNRLVRNEEKSAVRTKHNEPNEYTTSVESADQVSHPQGGLMAGALNAMGGLLSRRKTPSNADSSSINMFSSPSPSLQPHSSQALDDSNTSDGQEESQPFHRVVSVPPGRIGMTFVQYRGHAMVSDVYKDSPLAGWVFPSDILIAIDEVPVSGMRVPEIVKLLTARKERPRALRIISSHAMTEMLITENSNALMDG